MVFQKIGNSQLKRPPHFVDLLGLNSGATATWNFATIFFVKFCLIGKFNQSKSIRDLSIAPNNIAKK